jgi:uncharacterized protein YjcR
MASKRKINQHNEPNFLVDIERVRTVMVWAVNTQNWFTVTKREVLERAEKEEIIYELNDRIFVQKRVVMVII